MGWQRQEFVQRHRLREVITLPQGTADLFDQGPDFGFRFHSLGYDLQAAGLAHIRNAAGDRRVFSGRVVGKEADEGTVQFQIVERNMRQHMQAGKSRAEIVQGRGNAGVPQLPQPIHHEPALIDQLTFGDFDLNRVDRHAVFRHGLFDDRDDAGGPNADAAQIRANGEVRSEYAGEPLPIDRDGLYRMGRKGVDEAVLFLQALKKQ